MAKSTNTFADGAKARIYKNYFLDLPLGKAITDRHGAMTRVQRERVLLLTELLQNSCYLDERMFYENCSHLDG